MSNDIGATIGGIFGIFLVLVILWTLTPIVVQLAGFAYGVLFVILVLLMIFSTITKLAHG